MIITVNGTPQSVSPGLTLARYLQEKQIIPDTTVVEHNLTIIRKDAFANTILNDGDTLEILNFVGGG